MVTLAVGFVVPEIRATFFQTGTLWAGLWTPLSVANLGTQITDFVGIPVVAAVILSVLGIALTIFAARKLMSAAPRR